MPGNTAPLYVGTVRCWLSDAVILAANTTLDLTSGTIYLLATGGVNGSRLDRLDLQPIGTNVATVIRLWVNNGQTTATAANNRWWRDYALPGTTTSATVSIPSVIVELNMVLEASFRLYATLGTTVAAGYHGLVTGGDY